jgi:sugar phosphate isomerase/epimerase
MSRRLALDHITAVDAAPVQLVETAAATGCAAVCLFMEPMPVLPLMPAFDLYGSAAERAEFRAALAGNGITFDVAYPFTLTGRTEVAGFARAAACAAELGAGLLNVLDYDREPARRVEVFGAFCDLAAGFGLKVAVEFYPPSQVPSLTAALDLVGAIRRPGEVGVNADLLHLMRSGGSLAELAAAPAGTVLYGQLADGPLAAPADREHEASAARQLGGEGAFDLAGFVAALPAGCPISVEIPRNAAVGAQSTLERAATAVASVRRFVG